MYLFATAAHIIVPCLYISCTVLMQVKGFTHRSVSRNKYPAGELVPSCDGRHTSDNATDRHMPTSITAGVCCKSSVYHSIRKHI